MRTSVSPSCNEMNQAHRGLLLSIHKDCRRSYQNRKEYDQDHKVLSKISYSELYDIWKQSSQQLVAGDCCHCDTLNLVGSDARSIRDFRQLVGIFSRLHGLVKDETSIKEYAQRVSSVRNTLPHYLREEARAEASRILGENPPDLLSLIPRHGPGAVAHGEKGDEKRSFSRYYPQLERVGGAMLFHLHQLHCLLEPQVMRVTNHPITKVVEVPKDMFKCRIISAEPLEMQFVQQSLMTWLMNRMEYKTSCINFVSQTKNALSCREWDKVATIDLSCASDLVSRRFIAQLVPPEWRKVLFALRSHFSRLSDGSIIPLRSFAPMGSALCFPMEALAFHCIVQAALKYGNVPKHERSACLVYGDDIIVPRHRYSIVRKALIESGFIPNDSKCCVVGGYRESCGAEWYYRKDITVTRPRFLDLSTQLKVQNLPMVEYANNLLGAGFVNSAKFIAERFGGIVAIGIGPGYAHPSLPWRRKGKIRYNAKYQRYEQRLHVVKSVTRKRAEATGYDLLFQNFTSGWPFDKVLTSYEKVSLSWFPVEPRWRAYSIL